MPVVTSKKMFEDAYKNGYAIGAFNVNNMEIIQGITEAAKELNAPLILQVSSGARKYANHTYLMKLIEAACIETELPICVHLDHGDTFELCKSCIDGGFSSVMIDGSHHPYEENVKLTRQVVEYAHDHGVVVEGELGRLEGVEDDVKVAAGEGSYTDPDQVQDFVSRTGVDSLAIAIGTSHGAYKFKPGTKPQLRFDILEEVEKRLPGFPIVSPRRLQRHPGVCRDDQPVRWPDAGRHRRAGGHAAQGRQHGRVQDQHRQRPAPRHDRHDPQVLCGASVPLRSAPVPQAGARSHQADGRAQDRRRARLQRQSVTTSRGRRNGFSPPVFSQFPPFSASLPRIAHMVPYRRDKTA